MATRTTTDPGLQQIENFRTWLLQAHTERLKNTPMTADERNRELVAVTATAEAVAEQLLLEYKTRTGR